MWRKITTFPWMDDGWLLGTRNDCQRMLCWRHPLRSLRRCAITVNVRSLSLFLNTLKVGIFVAHTPAYSVKVKVLYITIDILDPKSVRVRVEIASFARIMATVVRLIHFNLITQVRKRTWCAEHTCFFPTHDAHDKSSWCYIHEIKTVDSVILIGKHLVEYGPMTLLE